MFSQKFNLKPSHSLLSKLLGDNRLGGGGGAKQTSSPLMDEQTDRRASVRASDS